MMIQSVSMFQCRSSKKFIGSYTLYAEKAVHIRSEKSAVEGGKVELPPAKLEGNFIDQLLKRTQRANPAAEELPADQARYEHCQEKSNEERDERPCSEFEHKELGHAAHGAGMKRENVV
jgi:hypothetical protein